MRILQISHNHHITGGSDAVYFSTTRLLEGTGHEVIPFCMASDRNEVSDWSGFFPKGADTAAAPAKDTLAYFYNFSAARSLERLLDRCGPVDVAHVHIYHGKQTTAILPVLKRRNIPIVQSLHEYKLACPVYTLQRKDAPCQICVERPGWNAVRHRCKDGSLLKSFVMTAEFHLSRLLGDVRHIDRFLCVSDFQLDVMRRAGLPGEKLHRLHNFVGLQETPAPQPVDKGYILYFGRLEKLKGLVALVEAFRDTSYRLVIAGSGSFERELSVLAEPHRNIDIVGFQQGDRLRNLLHGSSAVVVPSEWYENCPMSVLEAKASGRPVLGARIGGIPELVRDGVDGFLFEPGSAEGIKQAVARLAGSDIAALGSAALHDANMRFSEDRHREQLLGHYRDLQKARAVGVAL